MQDIFLHFEHGSKFTELNSKLSAENYKDKPSLSVFFLMAGNEELKKKVIKYFDFENVKFNYDEMLESEEFSPQLHVLAKLSIALYNGKIGIDITELSKLDPDNLKLALKAIEFRYAKSGTNYKVKSGISILD